MVLAGMVAKRFGGLPFAENAADGAGLDFFKVTAAGVVEFGAVDYDVADSIAAGVGAVFYLHELAGCCGMEGKKKFGENLERKFV